VLDALPDDLLVPLAFVERGRIHTTETQAPERPFAAMETLSYSTERYRCLSPIAVPEYMAVIHGRVERGELEAKLLVERSALDHLGAYDRFDEMVAHGGFHLGATDERVPYGLLIADDREVAALFSYGDDGMVRGMLISDAPEAYAWADRRYTEFERDAAVIDGS
jgi:predicted transcriptional regulator